VIFESVMIAASLSFSFVDLAKSTTKFVAIDTQEDGAQVLQIK